MISGQEVENIKQKLISHINSTFPEEQKQPAIDQINSMNPEQLENFLEKNNIVKQNNSQEPSECVFCSIIAGNIKSVKIDENREAIAVLDINPISKGHLLVIPKKHGESDNKIMKFAEKISKKIKKKFSPRAVEFQKVKLFGHETIGILPVYQDENFKSERNRTSIEELENIKTELETKKPKAQPKKSKIQEIKEKLWLPKRIP